MTVKIKIPSKKGHDTLILSQEEAQKTLNEYAQNDWLIAINNKIDGTHQVQDGDEVQVVKNVYGG